MAKRRSTSTTSSTTTTTEADDSTITRNISVVVLSVTLHDPTETWGLDEVLLQLFAFTPPVTLRASEDDPRRRDSAVQYAAGDYDKEGKKVWTGRLERIRQSKRHSMTFDRKRGNVFHDDDGAKVTTAETTSYFAFHEDKKLIVYRDQASMPFTRVISYVAAALSAAIEADRLPAGMKVTISPRTVERTVSEWFKTLTSVRQITLKYGPAQSPGDTGIGKMLKKYRAKQVRETVVAEDGENLDTKELLSQDHDLGKGINHINVNPKNGVGEIDGAIDKERVLVTTRKSPERHRLPAGFTRREILKALVLFALNTDDDDERS